jgi:hypothetical protein
MDGSVLAPVYYPRAMLPGAIERMLLNPMTRSFKLYRWSLLGNEVMRSDAHSLSGGVILDMLVRGLLFFIKLEPGPSIRTDVNHWHNALPTLLRRRPTFRASREALPRRWPALRPIRVTLFLLVRAIRRTKLLASRPERFRA